MFKKLTAIACLIASAAADINNDFNDQLNGEVPVDQAQIWAKFEKEFGDKTPVAGEKSYTGRKLQLIDTVNSIVAHNKEFKEGKHNYQKGINMYSDMSNEEFVKHFNIKYGEDQHCSATNTENIEAPEHKKVPTSWDWRKNDGVTPVKNQGSCGSCWTFSTVGALEAHELLRYKEFTSLSEQQLVDCAGDYDNHGCDGGLPSHAFEYVMHSGGISTEKSYPYFGKDEKCTVKESTYALTVPHGSVNITEGDEVSLKNAIYEHGPVSVCFQVVDGFKDYKTGVYVSKTCKNSTMDVNHAVLAVGYGNEDGKDYWIIKNSWGEVWGDKGYFKMERGVNMCGVAVCNSYPKEVKRIPHEQTFLQ